MIYQQFSYYTKPTNPGTRGQIAEYFDNLWRGTNTQISTYVRLVQSELPTCNSTSRHSAFSEAECWRSSQYVTRHANPSAGNDPLGARVGRRLSSAIGQVQSWLDHLKAYGEITERSMRQLRDAPAVMAANRGTRCPRHVRLLSATGSIPRLREVSGTISSCHPALYD